MILQYHDEPTQTLFVYVFIKHVCVLWCCESAGWKSRGGTGKQSVCTVKATLTVVVPEGLRRDAAMIKNKAALRQTVIQLLQSGHQTSQNSGRY